MPVTMSSQDFTAMVRKRGEFDSDEEAEQATRATLETLGERVSGGQAQDMAAELPEPLGGYLTARAGPKATSKDYDFAEFCRRVADREPAEIGPAEAQSRVRAVLTVLQEAVSDSEWENMCTQLPNDYRLVR